MSMQRPVDRVVPVQTATNYTANCSVRQKSSWQHLVVFCNLSPAQWESGIWLQGITCLRPMSNDTVGSGLPFKFHLPPHNSSPKGTGICPLLLPFCDTLLASFFALLYPRSQQACTTPAADLLTVGFMFKDTLLLVAKSVIQSLPQFLSLRGQASPRSYDCTYPIGANNTEIH